MTDTTTDRKGEIAREEEDRKKALDALSWFDLGRGAGKDEFLRCRLLQPGSTGPWLIVTVCERRSYSTKAKVEATNETVVSEAITRSMVLVPNDPRMSPPTHRQVGWDDKTQRVLTEGNSP